MDAAGLKRFYLDNKSMLDKSSEMLRELLTRICRSGNSSDSDSGPASAFTVSENATTQSDAPKWGSGFGVSKNATTQSFASKWANAMV